MNLLASMRYLVALNEHRHFGRAAQASHITQPALSNALRALEREFGVLIVNRSRTYAGLTAEGEAVLLTAQRMLREQELLTQRLRSESDRPTGRLRLASVPTAMPILSRFAVELQARQPGIAPTVVSLSSLEIETALDSMAVDLALGYTDRMRVRNVKLDIWPQCTERYHLVQRLAPTRAHRTGIRIGPPASWSEAADLPLCLLTPEMHNRAIVDRAFRQSDRTVTPAMETNSIHTLASSIGVGALAGVLPDCALELLRDGPYEVRSLISPAVETPLGFMTYSTDRRSLALRAAIDLLNAPDWKALLAGMSGAGQSPLATR